MNKPASFIMASAITAVAALASPPTIVLSLTDGTTVEYPASEVREITFRLDDEEQSPIAITVDNVTVNSVKASLKAADPETTFLFGIIEKSEYDRLGGEKQFFDYEFRRLNEEAEGFFDNLTDYLDFLIGWDFDPDGQVLNRDGLKADTEYYIYAYGINTKAELTTGLVIEPVKTNGWLSIGFNLATRSLTSTTATLTASPDNSDEYYYLGYIAKHEYDEQFKGDDEHVVNNALASIRMIIGNDGSRLGEMQQVRKGAGSLDIAGLTPDMEYYAIAFGIDNTVTASTLLTKLAFRTEAVAVTDDCTFEVSRAGVTPMLIDIDVKPSSPATRYFVTIRNTAEAASLIPSQVADNEVAFQNGFNPPVNWATDPRMFNGDRTLNSRKDLGITVIRPDTRFTVYVFGVSDNGVRTTGVATLDVKTPAASPSAMTLDISGITAGLDTDPNDFAGWGPKTGYFSYSVTPSVNNEYYYTGVVRKSDYEKFESDDAFMAEAIRQAGDYIMLNCFMGADNNALTSSPVPFKTTADYAGTAIVDGDEYYIFSFGYAGIATTPLFKQPATAARQ